MSGIQLARLLVALILLAVCAGGTMAQCGPIQFGSLPSIDGRGVEVVGDLAFIAGGMEGLLVLEISESGSLIRVGQALTLGEARDVRVIDGNAYVASEDYGLEIFNVQVAALPTRVGGLSTPGQFGAFNLEVGGQWAYVAATDGGLCIFDVTCPDSPVLASQFEGEGTFAYGIALEGDVVYLLNSGAGLEVVDVSDPAAPMRIGGFAGLVGGGCADVRGGLLYTATADGLSVFDVSDPSVPVLLGNYPGSPFSDYRELFLYEDLVIAGRNAAIDVLRFNKSNIVEHIVSASVRVNGIVYGVSGIDACADGSLVVSIPSFGNSSSGVVSRVDLGLPLPRVIANVEHGAGETQDIEQAFILDGDLGYYMTAGAGLRVFDLNEPAAPSLVGALDDPAVRGDQMVLTGDTLIVLAEGDRAMLIDVSDPSAPVMVGMIPQLNDVVDVDAAGGLAVFADRVRGVRVFSVEDPAQPLELGMYVPAFPSWGVMVTEHGLLVTMGLEGLLELVDLKDPSEPGFLGSVQLAAGFGVGIETRPDFLLDGSLLYVVEQLGTFAVLDVSDPSAIELVSRSEISWAVDPLRVSLALQGDYLAVASRDVVLYDVGDPDNPTRVGKIMAGFSEEVALRGGVCVVADWDEGLQVLAMPDCYSSLCPADLAPSFGVLDFDDVLAFLTAFGASEPAADLSEPFGVIDFDDVLAFLVSFGSGCP